MKRRPTDKRKTRRVCAFESKSFFESEIHQQEYGNYNYVVVVTKRSGASGPIPCKIIEGGETFTVYTKSPECGRGEYAEELDIEVPTRSSRGLVWRIAEAVIAAEFDPSLRPSRIVRRVGTFL